MCYRNLSCTWTAIRTEKESLEALDQAILLLGQSMNTIFYIRRFNILMSFVNDNKKLESMIKKGF